MASNKADEANAKAAAARARRAEAHGRAAQAYERAGAAYERAARAHERAAAAHTDTAETADIVVTCVGTCSNASPSEFDIQSPSFSNATFTVKMPKANSTLTWQNVPSGVLQSDSGTANENGIITFTVLKDAPTGGPWDGVITGTGCDTPCGGPNRPSMKVT